jgi:hypothetical protein
MSILMWIIVPVAAGFIVAFIVSRFLDGLEGRRSKYADGTGAFVPPVRTNAPAKRRHVYHGAVMEPGFDSCEAADLLRGERYLPADAPTLPLPDCDKSKCECLIRPSQDRRLPGGRRGEDMSVYADENDIIVNVRTENRERGDRRES